MKILYGMQLSFSLVLQVLVTLWETRNSHALHDLSYTVLGCSVMSFDFCSVGSEMTNEVSCLWISSTKTPIPCTAGMSTSSCSRNISDSGRDLWHNVDLHDCATSSGNFEIRWGRFFTLWQGQSSSDRPFGLCCFHLPCLGFLQSCEHKSASARPLELLLSFF
jgi:hypothetical protein